MTREEAKELLPIIQAYAEGKTIEERDPHGDWKEAKNPIFTDSLTYSCVEYRIKPESKYRPFETKAECWNEMLKHQPFGWIKKKDGSYINKLIVMDEKEGYGKFLEESITFADETPFGVKED